MPLVRVEAPGSSVLRGLAVPFHEHAYIEGKDGDLFAEVFDEESIPRPPQNVPLLVSHDRDRPPAGKVLNSFIMPQGLGIEAKLVGDDHELEGWRRRFDAGLMVGLSIGFRASSGKAIWEPSSKRGMPPVKRVRGAEIVEVSIVNYPAYDNAATLSLNQRSFHEEEEERQALEAHEKTQEIIAWVKARKASRPEPKSRNR
jgi:phage head maturation protease